MTNKDILKIALEQSAEDIGCKAEDFLTGDNRLVEHKLGANAKSYYELPILKERPCGYELRMLEKEQFKDLYLPEWSNALCSNRKELDVLAAGAYDGDKLIGLAGCSADAHEMWQIGVDVLPDYRRQGIASALTSRLALEILDRGKVPFYCTAWSNLRSVRNAVKCGFIPAWVEMTVKPITEVDKMNKED